ncbi:hypothetical protein GCM10007108_10020 [Thermogymnomonas acidicola]|uniref:Uncharacterized protein n=1 Tax=Thermogymnomonas acidicola TaxID=399579 RepID=A0AA37FAJ3_9ARCH|nr:hypothetical protein GCM10007108_10020 [Thermogymnomonas acidicola]
MLFLVSLASVVMLGLNKMIGDKVTHANNAPLTNDVSVATGFQPIMIAPGPGGGGSVSSVGHSMKYI